MKATVPDESFHYHFTITPYLEKLKKMFPVLEIRNRAVFGSCVAKGEKQLEKDLKGTEIGSVALIEFGGNDCNFHWNEIAENPDAEHLPYTTLEKFLDTIEGMARSLKERGVRPVLMTLPPIDAHKYLSFIGRDGTDCGNILKWLGDTNMIYRFHEMYSNAIAKLAFEKGYQLIDMRSSFLDKHNYSELISEDGIHPSEKGYDLMFRTFAEVLSADSALLEAAS
jgi:lysophospholipase L1-like esterase